jgi:hypothetical protein
LQLALPSRLDRHSYDLDLSLYGCLPNRSDFEQTLNAVPPGVPTGTDSIPLSSLPAAHNDPANGVQLSVAVQAGDSPPVGSGPFTAVLSCSESYYGVYPLQVQLTNNATSQSDGSLTTYLVYTDASADTQPLRVALIVPLSAGNSSASGPAPRTRSTDVSEIQALAQTLSAYPRAAVTLMPEPSSLSWLPASSLVQLASLSQGREVLCVPFADVDASSMVASGLTSELSYQIAQGSGFENALHANCQTPNTWVSTKTLDQSALDALNSMGYRQVVVPQSGVLGPAPNLTQSNLFDLPTDNSGPFLAASIDPDLSSRLSSPSQSDPALAAHQFVAELEQIYFEAPYAPTRGVVAVAPADIDSDPQFLFDVLALLQSNPMVSPVTLSALFSQVSTGDPGTRRPATATGPSLPARSIRSTRARLQSFAAAVSQSPTGASVVQQLSELLLDSESSSLSAKQQQASVADASNALDKKLHRVSVDAGEIHLASNAAPVPITIVKTLPYPVTGVLQVTSDKLVFPQPGGSPGDFCTTPKIRTVYGRSSFSSQCTINHSTNVIYVDMRTRATGDFPVSVSLMSPNGGLQLADAQVTVRSFSISAVSIGLSVAAAAVLLFWWGRTFVRKRQGKVPRRPAHARGARPAS